MIGQAKKKLISSLSQKKYRDKHGLFVAEGPKLLHDLLEAGIQAEMILTTENVPLPETRSSAITEIISAQELKKISFLKTPQKTLAVFRIPSEKFHPGQLNNQLSLALDGIQDPGNMGTIIRMADWFGISTIVCSKDTVDCFNPKVVQASMGALARVRVIYTDLPAFFQQVSSTSDLKIFGTFMDGENIYALDLPSSGIIVMGNEGSGIRPETGKYITRKIAVPSSSKGGMESLNVGIAAAIVCSEFRRTTLL